MDEMGKRRRGTCCRFVIHGSVDARGRLGTQMANSTQDGDESGQDPSLAMALDTFDRLKAAILAYAARLQHGAPLNRSELKRLVSDFGQAYRIVSDERKKVEEYSKQETPRGVGYALDFDAARAEVGRRLDRLRAAG